jgi:hypothetical protein
MGTVRNFEVTSNKFLVKGICTNGHVFNIVLCCILIIASSCSLYMGKGLKLSRCDTNFPGRLLLYRRPRQVDVVLTV